ncbi:MAG: hypothetical protein HZA32_08370 [Opitutae bacterium]|nr:hypothetical protein [Opitutae bacterium]
MRRSKEIVVLLVLLVGVMAFVLWFVRARRAELKSKPAAEKFVGPVAAPNPPVDLAKHDAKTIDFSSGKPIVKDTAADQAALQQGLKDIEEATRSVTFDPPKQEEPKKP